MAETERMHSASDLSPKRVRRWQCLRQALPTVSQRLVASITAPCGDLPGPVFGAAACAAAACTRPTPVASAPAPVSNTSRLAKDGKDRSLSPLSDSCFGIPLRPFCEANRTRPAADQEQHDNENQSIAEAACSTRGPRLQFAAAANYQHALCR